MDLQIDLLTVPQVAKLLGISREGVYRAIREGRLGSREVLGRLGVPPSALANYNPSEAKIQAGKEMAAKRKKAAAKGTRQAAGGRAAKPAKQAPAKPRARRKG